MLHIFAVFILILSLFSSSTMADTEKTPVKNGEKPNLSLYIPPEAAEAEDKYSGLFKNLTNAQQDIIKAYESEYAKTSDTELEIASMAMKLKYCSEKDTVIAKSVEKYTSYFNIYRKQLQVQQRNERMKIRTRQVEETAFMDPAIMDRHFAYTSNIVFQIGFQVVKMNYEKGEFAKTDCDAVAKQLHDASLRGNPISGLVETTPAKVQEIQRLAKNGDAAAMYLLGMLQVTGNGVPKDTREGLFMLKKAADKGHEPAQFTLGVGMTTDMFGQPPDLPEARYWLEKSAAQGNAKAAAALEQLEKK